MEEKKHKNNSYLSFRLGKEEFASHVNKVINILEMSRITKVPKAPEYMKGVINLRGTVLPVIDTCYKFGLDPIEFTENTCIVVMDLKLGDDNVLVGALVDEVISVLEISQNEILPPPNIGNKFKSEFITGMVKVEENFVMVLDMEKVFDSEELMELKSKMKKESQVA